MKKLVICLLLGLVGWCLLHAQPFPGDIRPGNPGDTAVYIATRTLAPGSGSGGSTNSGSINNFFVTNLYVTVSIVTNQYVMVSQFVNNQFVTNEFVSLSFVTNLFVNQSFITNLFVTTNFVNTEYVTNFYANHSFITNLTVNNLTVQNFFAANSYFTTNAFPSATNTFDLTNSIQLLQTFTPMAVTNLGSVSNNYVGQGLLIVSNASSTGITVTVTVPNITAIGAQTTNRLLVASGQMAWVKFFVYGNVFTNYVDDLFPGLLASQYYVNVATNGMLVLSPQNNGNILTNLNIQYNTNVSPSSANLTFVNAYETNLTTDVTILGFTMGNSFYETLVYSCTNSGGTDKKVTFPNGVVGPPGSGTPPVLYCTNKLGCDMYVSHFGNRRTNCWKIDWAP